MLSLDRMKLWYYYANKEVKFTDIEKKLLSELGIKYQSHGGYA